MVGNSCRRTLTTLIQKAMAPIIKDFLLKSKNLVTHAARNKNAVLNYLLGRKPRFTQKDNFERVLAVIGESSAQTLEELVYVCIDDKKPPSYFETLLDVLKILCDFFYGPVIPRDKTLTRMRLLLQLSQSAN